MQSIESLEGEINDIVDQASNGQEAVDAVIAAHKKGDYQYGIIFMDCSMPIMDGYDASKTIRKYLH